MSEAARMRAMPNDTSDETGAALRAARRVCLFAHYDRDAVLADYVLHHLERLKDCGVATVFISPVALSEADLARLRPFCAEVILRDNAGHDFGSWAEAWKRRRHDLTGDLILANDSVYGPLGPLDGVFADFDASGADFYGLAKSLEIAPHLQSWFLTFKPQVHRSKAFEDLMSMPFADMPKRRIIETAEVGLTRTLTRSGFRCGARFDMAHTHITLARRYNPTHALWEELIRDDLVPYIKVELLRDNPLRISNVSNWRALVHEREPALVAMIEAHRARVGTATGAAERARLLDFQEHARQEYASARPSPLHRRIGFAAVVYALAVIRRALRLIPSRILRNILPRYTK